MTDMLPCSSASCLPMASISALRPSMLPWRLAVTSRASLYLPQVALAFSSRSLSSSSGFGLPIRPLVFWIRTNQPQSLLARYLRKFLCPTLMSSLWSYFFLYTYPRILLNASPWIIRTHLITSLSRSSSRAPREQARKKTRVCPSLYLSRSKGIPSMRAYTAVLLSSEDLMAAWPRQEYLSLKSRYSILLGNPRIQILIPSSTPLQVSWCMMSGGLHLAGLLVGVGHKATHKVGLAGVEGGHQLNQRNQVDRGDSLAATLLLLLA